MRIQEHDPDKPSLRSKTKGYEDSGVKRRATELQ